MTKRIKTTLALVFALLTLVVVTSCGVLTPYDEYDKEGYTVSVKFDANGGTFTTNTSVITDTARLEDLTEGEGGMKKLPVISPDNPIRGSGNAFSPTKSGYFLAGWYTERTPVTDGDGNELDADGNIAEVSGKEVAYTYSGYWNFDEDSYYLVDATKEYTSSTPALTLYAAWVPEFSYEFYDNTTGAHIGTTTFNPTLNDKIALPSWDAETGALTYGGVPKLTGKTFANLYTTQGGTAFDGASLTHHGVFNKNDATAENSVMRVYLDYIDGEWFRITTAEQFRKNAMPGGCYYIEADLDFAGRWVTAFNSGFTGKIIGNGHTISNVKHTAGTGRYNALFGQLGATAVISDLKIDAATLTINKPSTSSSTANYGLLAGVVQSGATVDGLTITNSTIVIEANIQMTMFGYIGFGLVAGQGYSYIDGVDYSGIAIEAKENTLGSNVYYIDYTVDGNTVTAECKKRA